MKGDRALVPEADFRSYYGRPILKPPAWKEPDVPLYLFLGGVAGASSVLAEGAAAADLPALRRVARLSAATGAGLGTVALIHDLGRPMRFLNMLRVVKPTSPLSVGTWILSPFAAFASAAAASEVTGIAPRLGRLAGVGAAFFGPPLSTYTAALLCNTAVPSWHEAHREMPFLFAGSASAAAGGLAMTLVPVDQAGPARRLAAVGAALELGATEVMEHNLGPLLAEPYKLGRPGRLLRAARALTIAGGLGSVVSGRSRVLSALSGLALMGGSVLMRFGVYGAGVASTKDPKYVVIPQRERLDRKLAGVADGHA
uniref:Formate dehydrogenase O putative subunit n=1 Tax=uncultured Nocardioidaceae bacterium TaxID=253824 RepID=A0A6J4LZ23_9ACTN|nr:MAG: Formate dehydrogenase O putative subunit [uncultured Nocardioidaceae bacterium]